MLGTAAASAFPFAIIALTAGPYLIYAARYWEWCFPAQIYPDQYLYFLFSELNLWSFGGSEFVNPWYRFVQPSDWLVHGKFYLGFYLFHLLSMLGRCWLFPLVAWMTIVSAALFFGVRKLLLLANDEPQWLIAVNAVTAAVLIVAPPVVLRQWLNFVMWNPTGVANTLFTGRFMYPQFPAVFLVVNLLFFTRIATGAKLNIISLVILVLSQFALLVSFPYAVVLVCATQGIVVVILLLTRVISFSILRSVLIYAIVAGVIDIAWFVLSGVDNSIEAQHGLAFAPSIERLSHLFGGAVLLNIGTGLLCLGAAWVLWNKNRRGCILLVVLAAFAVCEGMLMLTDGILSAPGALTDHFSYLSDFSIMLGMGAAFVMLLKAWRSAARRWIVAVLAAGAVMQIFVVSVGIAAMDREVSRQYAYLRALRGIDLKRSDLLLVPSEYAGDVATWAPLVAPAEVLFSLNAFYALRFSPAVKGHRERFDLYAFFSRKSRIPNADFAFYLGNGPGSGGDRGDRYEDFEGRQHAVALGYESYRNLIAGKTRLVVVELSSAPLFNDERLARYFSCGGVDKVEGTIRIKVCSPGPPG